MGASRTPKASAKASGVEVRANSIRLHFTLEGVRQRHTLTVNGEPLLPTPANLKYASRLIQEIKEKIKYGTFSLAEYFPTSDSASTGLAPLTVGTQLDNWLASQRIAASTRSSYQSVIKFWKKELGDKPIKALKYSEVRKALAAYPHISGKTINNRTSVLREALSLAVMDKLLSSNPMTDMPSAKWQRQPIDPFTQEEVQAILAYMKKHFPEQVYNYTKFKFFTGVRTGESFGLKWTNIDLASKRMTVKDSIVLRQAKTSTKTNVSRLVYLNSQAYEAIAAQQVHTMKEGEYVFHDPRDNKHWTGEGKFRFYWLQALKALGIRHRSPYTTRHTYATLMLMSGVRPAFAATQMGHSIDMFLRTYAKWIPGAGDMEEMAKLEKLSPECPQEVDQL